MTDDNKTTRGRDWLGLGVFLAASFAAGGVGQLLSGGMPGAWYRGIQKPAFTPPGWVFGPVWTGLYVCMALAAWLVWLRRGSVKPAAPLGLFAVQLVLNGAWSGLFFGLHSPALAFVDIVLLWAAIVATTWAFFRCRAAAGWLMLPYLLWVSFAAVLNAAIWRLNP